MTVYKLCFKNENVPIVSLHSASFGGKQCIILISRISTASPALSSINLTEKIKEEIVTLRIALLRGYSNSSSWSLVINERENGNPCEQSHWNIRVFDKFPNNCKHMFLKTCFS